MSTRAGYPHGVPHWTTCLVRDLEKATQFYGHIFGWNFSTNPTGDYAEATIRGRKVAGIGTIATAGANAKSGWLTEVGVDDATAAYSL